METIKKGRVNERAVTRAVDEAKEILAYTKAAVEKLRKYFSVKKIGDVKFYGTADTLADYLQQSEDEYLGKKFIPKEEKQRIHNQYNDILRDLQDACNAVEAALRLPFQINFDGTQLVSDEKEMRRYYEQQFYSELTDEDVEYYGILSNIISALDAADSWEQEHNYTRFVRNGDPLQPSTMNIFGMWLRGEFSADNFTNMVGGIIGKISQEASKYRDE